MSRFQPNLPQLDLLARAGLQSAEDIAIFGQEASIFKKGDLMRERNPLEWAVRPLKHYADFNGRAPRAEFWWYYLLTVILGIPVGMLDNAFDAHNILSSILNLALFLPWLAVSVRRLHDTNRSGWWLLFFVAVFIATGVGAVAAGSLGSLQGSTAAGFTAIVILIGFMLAAGLAFLVFMVLPGTAGPNDYGADPYARDDLQEVFA